MRTLVERLRGQIWVFRTLVSSGMLTLLRPDKYVAMWRIVREQGTNATTGFSLAAARRPAGTALVDERGSLTWRELEERSRALAAGLRTTADGPTGAVAILCRNHRGLVESLKACALLGSDALLLNTGFSGPQLADVMQREQASLIVYDEEFDEVLAEARSRVDGLVEIIAWVDTPGRHPRTVDRLIAEHLGHRTTPPPRPGRVVLLTSGTTGTPKGARRGGGGPDELAGMLDRIPWRAEETVVVAAPMFHAWGFGQLVVAATMTCTVVMRRRFDPEATLRLVQEHDASGLCVVPVMLERIMDLPDEVLDRYRLPTLRFVSASGSRMRADSVLAFMDRFGDVVHNSYNATEAGQISVAGPGDLREAPDTAGRPVRGTDVLLIDDAGREVADGEVGRIAVRGASEFEGYTAGDAEPSHHADASEPGRALPASRGRRDYLISGDVGRLDAAGRLFVVGRDDDMIVSGGENVYPLEVERALAEHDGVREVAVVGVPDEDFGQRLAAVVVPEPGREPSVEDLRAHVKGRLAGYKVPREVVFVDELPRNASGKVVTRDLPVGGG